MRLIFVGVGREWESFFREWTGRDFPPVFSWDWDGMRLIFVGVGRERFENSLPCHPLMPTTLPEQSKALHLLHGRSKNVSV